MRRLLLLISISMWLSVSIGEACSHLRGYSKHGTSCFKLYTTRKTWAAAEESCVAEGGHLASIHSSEEQAFVATLVSGTPWIGLSGNVSAMAWSDNTQFDYEHWDVDNPNVETKTCGRIKSSLRSFKWGDVGCTLSFSYICRSDMVGHEAQAYFTKVPAGAAIDSTVNPASKQPVRSRIECASRCQQDGRCVHFIMNEDGGEYFCEIYTTMTRPPTATPPTNNYQKIIT